MLNARSCGVLLHPTSLPGPEGIGTLGQDARRFVDLLSNAGISFWQILPLSPPACGESPYSSFSVFAGNPLLIDLSQLVLEGDLHEMIHQPDSQIKKVDFNAVKDLKMKLLSKAAVSFLAGKKCQRMEQFWHFCDTTPWLHDYALFMALKKHHNGTSWHKWPAESANLQSGVYEKLSVKMGPEIGIQKYIQWQFYRQWQALRSYANSQGIKILGDLPIFVAYDSVDVWCNRKLFLLDENGKPRSVAGVPPDYFSSNGQLWGNPLYDWNMHYSEGYSWWIERIRHTFSLFDTVRIDHFRGFESAWHVPASHRTAKNGKWVKGPAKVFFEAMRCALGDLPIIAEDLGVITPEVVELRDGCGFPGMKILQFAFDSGSVNPYLPHNFSRSCVVYTGTHDNDTTLGWYNGLTRQHQLNVCNYIGCCENEIVTGMIRVAMMSVADMAIIPFQDILGLDSSCRMNIPGTAYGNWAWRFSWDMEEHRSWPNFADMIKCYGRCR